MHFSDVLLGRDISLPKILIISPKYVSLRCDWIFLVLSHLQVVQEQLSRPEERRCPIAKASNEVVDLLSEHWSIFGPGCTLYQSQ